MIKNPIIRGFNPDPSICIGHDGAYYLVVSSFEYYPLIPIYRSVDLINWEIINFALKTENMGALSLANLPDSQGIFAPTIRYDGNRYYILSTMFNTKEEQFMQNFLIHTKDPKDLWSEPILFDVFGIDPSIYIEGNKGYIHYASWNDERSVVKQFEIDLETFKTGESKELTFGSGGRDPEAPHIYKKNGVYYLIMAEGGTREGHMVTMFYSNSVWGPFIPYENNPILTHRNFSNHPFQNIGHADLIKTKNDLWYMVLLGIRPKGMMRHNMGRETFIKKISWDGFWPEISSSVKVYEDIEVIQKINNNKIYDWTKLKTIPYEWTSIRQDYNNFTNLTDKGLEILSKDILITDSSTPTLLMHRQEEYQFTFESIIDFKNSTGKNGLVILNGSSNYVTMLLNSNSKIEIKKQCYDIIQEEEYQLEESNEVTLFIKGDYNNYYFGVKNNNEYIILSKIRREVLSTEVSESPFTGTLFGNYSIGNNTKGIFVKTKITNIEQDYDWVDKDE